MRLQLWRYGMDIAKWGSTLRATRDFKGLGVAEATRDNLS